MSADAGPMFRAMKMDEDGSPAVGQSARMLGVRLSGTHADIPVQTGGLVRPGTGGMSVAVDAVSNLPQHKLPLSLGGDGRDPVFALDRGALSSTLALRVQKYPHGLVEPSKTCAVTFFESALESTRVDWRRVDV